MAEIIARHRLVYYNEPRRLPVGPEAAKSNADIAGNVAASKPSRVRPVALRVGQRRGAIEAARRVCIHLAARRAHHTQHASFFAGSAQPP